MNPQVLLKGKDALDLLHRISTVNVPLLGADHFRPGLILNPQGKIECAFELRREAAEATPTLRLRFESDTMKKRTLEILEHYTFGERYQIEEIAVDTSTQQTEFERIQNLIPRAGHEYFPDGQTNPLEINFRSAIDDQKGCYPGQEIIEKIIAIGSPARRLCLLKLEDSIQAPVTPPCALFDEKSETEVGTLTSLVTTNGGECSALGIIRKTHAKEKLILKTNTKLSFTIEKVSP